MWFLVSFIFVVCCAFWIFLWCIQLEPFEWGVELVVTPVCPDKMTGITVTRFTGMWGGDGYQMMKWWVGGLKGYSKERTKFTEGV